MRYYITIFLLWGMTTSIGFAQQGFVHSYGVQVLYDIYAPEPVVIPSYDNASIILSTSSNGVISLFKVDSEGSQVWAKQFNDYYFKANSLTQTKDSGFCIAGRLNYLSGVDKGAFILKTDKNGKHLWSKKYNDIGQTEFHSICEGIDGSLMLTGTLNVNKRYFVAKTDSKGNLVWVKYFKELTGGLRINNTHDGNFTIAGWGGFTKIDKNGAILWSKYYNISTDYSCNTKDGGFLLSTKRVTPFIIKTDSLGTLQWIYEYYPYSLNGNIWFLLGGIVELEDGKILMTGTQSMSSRQLPRPWAMMFNDTGKALETEYLELGSGALFNSYPLQDGGYITLGGDGLESAMNLYLFKTGVSNYVYCTHYPMFAYDTQTLPYATTNVDTYFTSAEFDVYEISMQEQDKQLAVNALCENFANSIGSINISEIYSISPNPASQTITISLKNLPLTADISIVDISGKTLYRTFFKNPEQKIQFDISPLLKGTYLVKVNANGQEFTQKLVVE